MSLDTQEAGPLRRRLGNDHATLLIAYRLYLPEAWANDSARRRKAGMPEEIRFQTKPEIALGQICDAKDASLRPATVLANAGYGVDTSFHDGITAVGLLYILGVHSTTSLWGARNGAVAAQASAREGGPPSLIRRDARHPASLG